MEELNRLKKLYPASVNAIIDAIEKAKKNDDLFLCFYERIENVITAGQLQTVIPLAKQFFEKNYQISLDLGSSGNSTFILIKAGKHDEGKECFKFLSKRAKIVETNKTTTLIHLLSEQITVLQKNVDKETLEIIGSTYSVRIKIESNIIKIVPLGVYDFFLISSPTHLYSKKTKAHMETSITWIPVSLSFPKGLEDKSDQDKSIKDKMSTLGFDEIVIGATGVSANLPLQNFEKVFGVVLEQNDTNKQIYYQLPQSFNGHPWNTRELVLPETLKEYFTDAYLPLELEGKGPTYYAETLSKNHLIPLIVTFKDPKNIDYKKVGQEVIEKLESLGFENSIGGFSCVNTNLELEKFKELFGVELVPYKVNERQCFRLPTQFNGISNVSEKLNVPESLAELVENIILPPEVQAPDAGIKHFSS